MRINPEPITDKLLAVRVTAEIMTEISESSAIEASDSLAIAPPPVFYICNVLILIAYCLMLLSVA